MAEINQSVYGAKENWYVPSEYSEFGSTQYADVYYYNQIAADDKLKIKVANYNTLESPVTTMRSQIDGQYTSESYLIKNNWKPTEFTMDNSIVQFGIGPQSGLSNQEWWYVDRAYGASNPSENDPPVRKNVDKYDITNMCLATSSNYTPYEFYSAGQGAITGGYDNNFMYWQTIRGQIFGTENSFFDADYSPDWGFGTGYVDTKLVTQIPVKNLKLTPVIYAYNSALDGYKKFTSIGDYLAEKSSYPYLFCIKAQFRYRSGYLNDTDYGYTFNCYPWFFNPSSFLSGYGYSFNSQNQIYGDVYYPNRGDHETGEGITVAGRPGYGHGPHGSMLGNEIYWYGHAESSSHWDFTIGQGGRVLQTPDFRFVLGNKNLFYCDTSTMTDDQITEGIRKQLASFGMFFVDGIADLNLALDDEKTFLGTLRDGIGYGDYTSGEDNRKQPQWTWDSMSENDYDPKIPIEPDIPDDSTEDIQNRTVLPSRGMLMPFTGSYVFDYLPLTGVINACTDHYIDMQDAIEDWNLNKKEYEDSLDFESYLWRQWGKQANPVDCLQNITYYPFNIRPYMTGLTTTSVIQVGSFVKDYAGTGITGSKVGASTTAGSIWCGAGEDSGMKFPITDANDFRSYAPYVSATLYLPFCGSIELDPQVFVGHTIKVNYLVDWRTGVCLALVYRDNLVVEAVSGQMGNKVNLQMLDGTTWAAQLANASVQESNAHFNRATNFFATVGGLVKIAAGTALIVGSQGMGAAGGGALITSGIGSVADGFVRGNQIDVAENKAAYDIGTTPIPTRQISTASPAVNASNEMRVRLVVFKSEEESSSNYAHTVGHACLKYGTLTSLGCTGYTVCQTIDTAGITATEAEKEKIRSLLMGGVYV